MIRVQSKLSQIQGADDLFLITNSLITMKKLLLLALLCISIATNIYLFTKQKIYVNPNFDNPVFIWNDDLESIPMDNTPVLLQFGSKNSDTLYLGPIEEPIK